MIVKVVCDHTARMFVEMMMIEISRVCFTETSVVEALIQKKGRVYRIEKIAVENRAKV